MKKHFLVLDSFRGICACIVAMSHFNANSIFYNSVLLDRGSIYVDFFFVLSGFVIFANYKEKLQQGYSILKFTLLRLGRIYPLHFAVMMAFIFVDLLQMFVNFNGAALYAPFSAKGESVTDIVAILLLVHSLHINEHLAFNGPSWSISVEFFTYILFALILSYTGKYYGAVILFTSLASAVLLYILSGELYAKLDYGILRCIFGFGIGALTWDIYQTIRLRIEHRTYRKMHINLAEIAAFALAILYISYFSSDALSMAAPFVFSIVILVFSFERGWISSILSKRPFLFVGMLSYSIYMIHMFIFGKFFALPIRLLEKKAGWNITFIQDGVETYGRDLIIGTCLELFYLLVVIAFSFVSYKLIEEPFRNMTRNRLK